jgi:predicted aminopeptidase
LIAFCAFCFRACCFVAQRLRQRQLLQPAGQRSTAVAAGTGAGFRVIADPDRDQKLRAHLIQSQKARTFASQQLHLPDNQSYRLYADIGRPYVVWNVFVTPEFSLKPQNHCFPIAGCVAYRGYYSQSAARGEAALQRLQGMDVSIGGVEAYSTLGLVQRSDHEFDDGLGR